MKKIKLTTGEYGKDELGIIMAPTMQRKTSRTTACMCHMIREMGDCNLNEVVKQVIKNKLW